MEVFKKVKEVRKFSFFQKLQGKQLGLVPTMGALHEGHLSLVNTLSEHADIKLASIFINPLQFNNKEDLKNYPKSIDDDLHKLEQAGIHAVFLPSTKEIYPNGKTAINMDYPSLTAELCGKTRPGHFAGVLVVVSKLLNIIEPDYAVFGEKDYQQLILVEKLVQDLSFRTHILRGPTVREETGLAMSSRNRRLTDEGRNKALCIYRAFQTLKKSIKKNSKLTVAECNEILCTPLVDLDSIDYAGLYHPTSLKRLPGKDTLSDQDVLMAIAGTVEGIRLIDNMQILQTQS